MKKQFVKILSLLIAVLTLVVSLPMAAFAETVVAASDPSGDQLSDPGYIEVNDGYIQIQVSKQNGGFYIGLVEGDKLTKADDNKNLLFPDSDYDTSFTSFRVKQDGKTTDYIFGGDYSHLGLETSEVSVFKSADNAITAVWTVGGITFTQILAYMDTNSVMHGMAYVTYSVENNSGSPIEDVQARVMMDTALGYQDYAIYMTANDNGSFNSVTTEKTIAGTDYSNFFYLYDSKSAPSVVAYTINATVGGEIIVPEQVTFAHWNNLAATEFDYRPSTENPIDFTSIYNPEFMTADSAVALYYDMGAPAVGETGRAVGLYYGVYSNHTVGDAEVSMNFINADLLELNEAKSDYLDANGEGNGIFSTDIRIQNVSDQKISSMKLAIMPGEYIYPVTASGEVIYDNEPQDPYYIEIKDLYAGEIKDIRLDFDLDVSPVTDYRRIKLALYDTSVISELTDDNLIVSKESYVFCPGVASAELGFTGMVPQLTGQTGQRFVYMTGTNFNLLRDKTLYRLVLRPLNGGEDVIIDSSRLVVNPELNTSTIVIEEELALGTWQLIVDWNDTQREDIVSDALRINVLSPAELDRASVISAVTNYISIVRSGEGTSDDPYHYEIQDGANKDALLQLCGNFNTLRSPAKGIYKAEAITLSDGEVITINGSLDVKGGRVTVTVEYDDDGQQTAINVDIDGKVYTTGSNTKVWDGICAITSLKEGELYNLTEYSSEGEREEVEGDTITLLWPGAASGAQTLVGLMLEMRYCEFGRMEGINHSNGTQYVVAFSAQLDPSFLIPNGADYEAARSPREEEEVRIVYANYTAGDLRRVDNRYEESDKSWRMSQQGTLNMYVDDILFGGYFIGFNTSVEVGIPAIVNGMPYIEGTLGLKIINDEWDVAVDGVADLNLFEMEASLHLKSYNGFPVVNSFYFYVGGFFPGVAVDPFGVFWIRGAGGGVDGIYETFFGKSRIPPLTLMLSGEFAIFSILSTQADLSISPHGFEAAFSDVELAGVSLIDYLGGSVYWYPSLSIACSIEVNILDAIVGGGGITVRQNFFEAYVHARVQIPKKIFLIGGIKIGSAELGVGTEKIWGKVKVIGIGVGITYFWGKKVDIDLLDAFNQSNPDFQITPVATDENGETLYMMTTNKLRRLGSTAEGTMPLSDSGIAATETGGITSSADKRTHTFTLDTATNEDGLISLTYRAGSESEAVYLKDSIRVRIEGESESAMENYTIRWLDTAYEADHAVNTGSNALFSYDSETGEASVTISFTSPAEQNGKKIEVTSGSMATDLTVYGIERFADITGITLAEDENGMNVVVTGDRLGEFKSINLYARDEKDGMYQIGTADLTGVTENQDGISMVTIPVICPASLPTGSYTVEAVGQLVNEADDPVATPVVRLEQEIRFENAIQPKAPTEVTATLGGDYSIALNVTTEDTDIEGYMVDIYEVTEDGPVATQFVNVRLPLAEGETVESGVAKSMLVGGQVAMTAAEGEAATLSGLEAGKTYVASVTTYKTAGTAGSEEIVESAAIETDAIVMRNPEKIEPTVSIDNAVDLAVGTTGLTIATTNNHNVTIRVADADSVVSGYYILGDGERIEWLGGDIALGELEDGMYSLTLFGANEHGDSFITLYQFSVDTKAPSIQITSPQGGGFYDSDSVTVTGIAEAGTKLTATAGIESVTVTVDNSGSFSVTVPLDLTVAYQDILITVEDGVGNSDDSYGFTLTNLLLGDPSLELVILLDGEEVSYITAGADPLQLVPAFKSGERYVYINQGTATAARLDWSSTMLHGEANVTNKGEVTGEASASGMITVSLDNYSATVEVIPTVMDDFDVTLILPEDGYVYDGTAKEPAVELTHTDALVEGVDYSVSYLNNVNAGLASVIITALDTGKCSGSKVLSFVIDRADLENAEITLLTEEDEPEIQVEVSGRELELNVDYTVQYQLNAEFFEGLVVIEGIGNYQGVQTLLYDLPGYTDEGESDTEPDDGTDTEPDDGPGTEPGDGPGTEPGDGPGTESGGNTGSDKEPGSNDTTETTGSSDSGCGSSGCGSSGCDSVVNFGAAGLVSAILLAFVFRKKED